MLTNKKTRINTKSTKEALIKVNEIINEQNKNKNIVRIKLIISNYKQKCD